MYGPQGPSLFIIFMSLSKVGQTLNIQIYVRLLPEVDASISKNQAASPLHAGMHVSRFLMWRTPPPLPKSL